MAEIAVIAGTGARWINELYWKCCQAEQALKRHISDILW